MGQRKRIKERLVEQYGVRLQEVETFMAEYEKNLFDENDLADWVAKARTDKPHRFIGAGLEGLAHDAFVLGNVTARGQLAKSMSADELDRIAQSFGLRDAKDFRHGNAPAAPGGEKPSEGDDKNPWSKHPNNIDPRTGRYSANAITRQSQIVKADVGMATRLAAKHGAKIGSVRPAA